MSKISVREFLSIVAIFGLLCAWFVDRNQLIAKHASEIQMREDQISTYRKAKRAMFGLTTEDIFKALLQRVELPTLVSGVESVSAFGFEFDDKVNVKLNNGVTVIQVVEKGEFEEARRLIAERKK